MSAETKDKYRVQIVERAIAVLFAFSASSPTLTLDDLAALLGINKTSLVRILRTLEAEEFIWRTEDRYRIGPRVLELANTYLSTLSFTRVTQGTMEVLARECGQTVSLAVLDGADVVYVAIEHAQRELGIQGEIGGRHPVHATALGKVLLANLEPSDALARLRSRQLERLTHRTLIEPDAVMRTLAHVRTNGFGVDDEERGIGIRCVAAPLHDHRGRVVAAMSVAGPIFSMQDEAFDRIRNLLLTAVLEIDRAMGHVVQRVVPPAEALLTSA